MEVISCIVPLLGFKFIPMFFQILAGDNGSEMMVMMWSMALPSIEIFGSSKDSVLVLYVQKIRFVFGLMVNSRILKMQSYCVGFRGLPCITMHARIFPNLNGA
jgi:hypothetical protein